MSIKIISRIVALLLFGSVIVYVVVANTTPHTVVNHYGAGSKAISKLSPQTRLEYIKENGQEFARLSARPVYFTVRARLHYDTAEVRVVYRNSDPKQQLRLGYRNAPTWSYAQAILQPSSAASATPQGWLVAERTYRLESAHYQKGTLGWAFEIAGYNDESKPVDIKSIEVTLTKKGWADD